MKAKLHLTIFIKIILFFCCFLLINNVLAQQKEHGVLVASGTMESSNNNLSCTFSIGNIYIKASDNSGYSVSPIITPAPQAAGASLPKIEDGEITCYMIDNMLYLTISDINIQNLGYIIYNTQGNILQIRDIKENKTMINMAHYAVGIYVLAVKKENIILKSTKFIKK